MNRNWKNLQRQRSKFFFCMLKIFLLWIPLSYSQAGGPSFFLSARNNYNAPSPSSEKLYRADERPHPLTDIQVKENRGAFIDLNLEFTDERGRPRNLQGYFQNQPVLMTVIYYNCPSLCNFHLNGLWTALNQLKWRKYQFVVLSMSASETPDLALQKKENYLKEFPEVDPDSVHFLTGSEEAIQSLTKVLGFSFRWDEETQQFAHSPVAYTLTPEGMISQYLYGVEFLPQTLKLSLLSAGRGKVGNMIDRILLFCYRFNPEANKYTVYAVNIMKVGGGLAMLLLIALIAPIWIREWMRKRRQYS